MIPVKIDLDLGQLIWRDLGRYHPYEGFFRKTLQTIDSLQTTLATQPEAEYFTTEIDVLSSTDVTKDSIYPSGFIFHLGRCGSTLLAKALMRSRTNLVFGEAGPHNAIWPYLGKQDLISIDWTDDTQCIYRNLILAMGRKRLPSYKYHFIKFTSFDILFIHFIMAAFPDVPALFIYREPAEVLVSLHQRNANWLRHQNSAWGRFISGTDSTNDDTLIYFCNALQNSMQSALGGAKLGLHYLDYRLLTKENFPKILSVFDVHYSDKTLTQMQFQFKRYSKNDFRAVPFASDKQEKQQALTPEIVAAASQQLDPLYEQLRASSQNIICA